MRALLLAALLAAFPARADACGDGLVEPGEACDDGGTKSGDGCSSACQLEAGFTCTGVQPTACLATCGTVNAFTSNAEEWTIVGTVGAFVHGAGGFQTSPIPESSVLTYIKRQIAIPKASAGTPNPALELTYRLKGDGLNDCLVVFVNTIGDGSAGQLAKICMPTTGSGTETVIVDLTSLAGTTRWAVIALGTDAANNAATSAFIDDVKVRSDADKDGLSEFAGQAACDPCIDVDGDGYGAVGSASATTCAAGASLLDCNDASPAVKPNAIEVCDNTVDDNCDAKTDLADPVCQDDCADGVDNGGNGLVDCADAMCAADPFCAPCSVDHTFDSGPGAWTTDNAALWKYIPVQGAWKTGGTDWVVSVGPGIHRGRLSLSYDVPAIANGGAKPRLEVVFKLAGEVNPAYDVFGICVNDPSCTYASSMAFKTAKETAPGSPPDGATSYNDGAFDHVFVDLSAHVGKTVQVSLLYDTVNGDNNDNNGLTIQRVVLASDADGDGSYEGPDAACDPCWDEDSDGYAHASSPGLKVGTPAAKQCPHFPQADCNDALSAMNPGTFEICNQPADEDCDGFINGQDSDCGTEDCANGKDDNLDGFVDCLDANCVNDVFCTGKCATEYTFGTGGAGFVPTDNNPDADTITRAFQFGKSTADNDAGWATVLNGNVSSAIKTPATSLRAFLQRTVIVPAGMPFPALEVRYNLKGDGAKDTFGVCFDKLPSQCHATAPAANITFKTVTSTVSGFDTQAIPIPPEKAGLPLDIVIFYDTQDTTGNNNPGVFISNVTIRSDKDLDGIYENDDASCDHCIDQDADGHGASDIPYNQLATCPNPSPDCDDTAPQTAPGIAEDCATAGDQNCNGLADAQELSCSVCGDGTVGAGETCDDGKKPPASGDGCSATCQVEAGALHVSEIHLVKLTGSPGEQWIELYNATNAKVDVLHLGLKLRNQTGLAQAFKTECVVQAGKSSVMAAKGYYVIALGPASGSDGLGPNAACNGDFQLNSTGDTLEVLDGDGKVMDTVDFNAFGCELSNDAVKGKARSLQLIDPATKSSATNDGDAAWCLAGPAEKYSNSGNHLGSPGTAGACAELTCDASDDDCDGTVDEGLLDTDADGHCDDLDCDKSVATCTSDCVTDADKDGTPDCKDGCLDKDGDGWGIPGGATVATCKKVGGMAVPDCNDDLTSVSPAGVESPGAAACADGLDNDCDGKADCLDTLCSLSAECAGETCASAEPIVCGQQKTVEPFENAFPCGSGADAVLSFTPTESETVTIHIQNLGHVQYQADVFKDMCVDQTCKGSIATATSTCAAPGSVMIPVTKGADYTLVADQIADCGGAGATKALVTLICAERCTGGADEDADGKVDCADPDCAFAGPCAQADLDGDGVANADEIMCGTDPGSSASVPSAEDLLDVDGDKALNCVDWDDDGDGASDMVEIATCALDATAKNDATIHPGAPKKCTKPNVDADCNGVVDQTESACGSIEIACQDANDNDADGDADCADIDCVEATSCAGKDLDGDGVSNGVELACKTDPSNPASTPSPAQSADPDTDGQPSCIDPDDDGDEFTDTLETTCGSDPLDGASTPTDPELDLDLDGTCDAKDTDIDDDGWTNAMETACGTDPGDLTSNPAAGGLDVDGDKVCDPLDPDDDGDGQADSAELVACALSPSAKNDATIHTGADKKCTKAGVDADCNGVLDAAEAACGGVETACQGGQDDDDDGLADCLDADCAVAEDCAPMDFDGDLVANGVELACGTDPLKSSDVPSPPEAADVDEDTIPGCTDDDDDGDTWSDEEEAGCGTSKDDPTDVPLDTDSDGTCDPPPEPDTDSDGWSDVVELVCGTNPVVAASNPTQLGTDADGDHVCDGQDTDDDGDGWGDADEGDCGSDPADGDSAPADSDQDGSCDPIDDDDDGDAVADAAESACGSDPLDGASTPDALGLDADGDGACDAEDPDDDGDGWSDVAELACGTDAHDGSAQPIDTDDDGSCDTLAGDTDGDGVPDAVEASCGTSATDPGDSPSAADLQDTNEDGQLDCADDDDDGDGVSDAAEASLGSDPLSPDTDGDGISDGAEDADHNGVVDSGETSPLLADTDGDGLADGAEAASCYDRPAGTTCAASDPKAGDTDGDGLVDGAEDDDADGATGDGETSPLMSDTDGDGVPDGVERACGSDGTVATSRPVDWDGNGICDGGEADGDLDGAHDGLESLCGTDPTSADSAPDAAALADVDSDGVADCADADDDGDGLLDVQETSSDPKKADTDGDGLPDGREAELGTDPGRADTDGDGLDDGAEAVLGTDPLTPSTGEAAPAGAPACTAGRSPTGSGWQAWLLLALLVRFGRRTRRA